MTLGKDKRASRARLWREKQKETQNFIHAVIRVQQTNVKATKARMAKGAQSTKVFKSSCGITKGKNIICYGCGKTVHIVRQCRYVKRALQNIVGDVKCYQCKQLGHIRRQCPQLRVQSHSGVGSPHLVDGVIG